MRKYFHLLDLLAEFGFSLNTHSPTSPPPPPPPLFFLLWTCTCAVLFCIENINIARGWRLETKKSGLCRKKALIMLETIVLLEFEIN